LRIAVIGYSGPIDKDPVKSLEEICVQTGRVLAQKDHTIITGGRDGVMELVARGAKEASGTIIGVLPKGARGNPYNTINLDTGQDYLVRSLVLIHAADMVISIGGEVGTLFEIVTSYAYQKPVILFRGTGGWTDRIAPTLIDGYYLDNRRLTKILQISSIEELMLHI